MYDMLFREWWNQDYGGSQSRQQRYVLSMTPLASWPEDSPGNKTLCKRCYLTFLRSCWWPAFDTQSDFVDNLIHNLYLIVCGHRVLRVLTYMQHNKSTFIRSQWEISSIKSIMKRLHYNISYILSTFDRSLICIDSACQFYGASISNWLIRLVPRSKISARRSCLLQNVANWREDRCRWWSSFQVHDHHRPAIIVNILAISKLLHDQDIGLLWLIFFLLLIVETATLKGFDRKHLAMLSIIKCCHFQSPHPRDSHQKDWDGKISWSMAAGVTEILSTVLKVIIFIVFLKISRIQR